jgi:peptidoglycan/LPS O-acetylase OafA/YrhL
LRLFPAFFIFLLVVVFWNNKKNDKEVIQKSIDESLFPCLAYYANWYFIGDVEYFGINVYENTLLHVWSLSVEEQFYLFWPILIYIIYFFSRFLEENRV